MKFKSFILQRRKLRSEKSVNSARVTQLVNGRAKTRHPKSQLSEHSFHLLELPDPVFMIARVILTKAKELRREIF